MSYIDWNILEIIQRLYSLFPVRTDVLYDACVFSVLYCFDSNFYLCLSFAFVLYRSRSHYFEIYIYVYIYIYIYMYVCTYVSILHACSKMHHYAVTSIILTEMKLPIEKNSELWKENDLY